MFYLCTLRSCPPVRRLFGFGNDVCNDPIEKDIPFVKLEEVSLFFLYSPFETRKLIMIVIGRVCSGGVCDSAMQSRPPTIQPYWARFALGACRLFLNDAVRVHHFSYFRVRYEHKQHELGRQFRTCLHGTPLTIVVGGDELSLMS